MGKAADRFLSIEGARAVLALWVVLGHLLQQSGVQKLLPNELSLLANANIPVGVFVVISGFVIGAPRVALSEMSKRAAPRWAAGGAAESSFTTLPHSSQ